MAPSCRGSRDPVVVANILFIDFFSRFFLSITKIVKIKGKERKKEKELGLPPKKCLFKVKSLPLFYAWSGSRNVWAAALARTAKYGLNRYPLTVNAPMDSLHISTALLG